MFLEYTEGFKASNLKWWSGYVILNLKYKPAFS